MCSPWSAGQVMDLPSIGDRVDTPTSLTATSRTTEPTRFTAAYLSGVM